MIHAPVSRGRFAAAALITVRLHRVELALVVVLVATSTMVGLVATVMLSNAQPTADCLQAYLSSSGVPLATECAMTASRFLTMQTDIGMVARSVGFVLPWFAGLVLGVSVVGKELESGTAVLAWSLTGRRGRWLVDRAVPLLAVALLGLLLAAWIGSVLREFALGTPTEGGQVLESLGSAGPMVVAAGALAFTVGLVAGTITGSMATALLVGVLVAVTLWVVSVPVTSAVMAESIATWQPLGGEGPDPLVIVERAYREGDGRLMSYLEAVQLASERCASCHESMGDEWIHDNLEPWARLVPRSAAVLLETAQVGVATLLLLATSVLALWSITIRRPP